MDFTVFRTFLVNTKKTSINKINSELFSSKNFDFDAINFGFQPKLFVNVPN